jgi:hypothetical protein
MAPAMILIAIGPKGINLRLFIVFIFEKDETPIKEMFQISGLLGSNKDKNNTNLFKEFNINRSYPNIDKKLCTSF